MIKEQVNMDEYNGAPKSWKMLTNDKLKENLSSINPNYIFGTGYKSNCVNCVMAYELRQRGYDVVAKSVEECNVSRKVHELWYGITEYTACSFKEVIDSIDIDINSRYFLGVKYPKGHGHALVMVILNKTITVVDAQIGKSYKSDELNQTSNIRFSFFRIDNLEISQTGYNACKGGR
jgi:hypothetical protein